jgi:photosystem II stability/assembly factor-like uncharacterized protein
MKIKYQILSLCLLIGASGCKEEHVNHTYEAPTGWELMVTPHEASLRGLSPINSDIVWASGSGGTWMRTINGGVTWDYGIIDGLDSVEFRDIEGFDAAVAIAISAGQPAVIYKTVDGGNTWTKKFQGPSSAFFDGMAFFKDNKGYVVGDPVDGKWMILETKDQGETWILLDNPPSAKEGDGSFAASGSGILTSGQEIWFASGGRQSNIYYTDNSGSHWQEIQTPIIQGEPSQGIFSLTRLGENILVAAGGDYLNPEEQKQNLILSTDNGKTWANIKGNTPSGYRSGIAYFPRNHWLLAVGPSGSDFSKNGGEDWERFSDEGFHAVFMDKAQTSVWASGSNGRIAKLAY